jgi:uncharacterized protein (DUF1684 family)
MLGCVLMGVLFVPGVAQNATGAAQSATGAAQSADGADAAYQQSIDQWKTKVDKSDRGWLTLAGLFWLKEGENSFGSASKNDIVFPKGPAHAGSFTRHGADVTVQLAPEVTATIDKKPGSQAKLLPDTSHHPTVVSIGSLTFFVVVRGAHSERIGIRLSDQENEAVTRWPGPQFFPVNRNYRVTATWVPFEGNRTIGIPDMLGDVYDEKVTGTLLFKIDGQEVQLISSNADPSKGLSFVFGDLTSKTDTYPGGRFLRTGPVVDGKVEVDFNKAYNPPCAVTPYATCPLAPKENRLAVAIPAGEKYDRATSGHGK